MNIGPGARKFVHSQDWSLGLGTLAVLPPDVRYLVYEYVFRERVHDMSARHNPRGPPEKLWTVSKTLYQEAMPFHFKRRTFHFSSVTDLGGFLSGIGLYNRQFISSIAFDWSGAGAPEAFMLLGSCSALERLDIYTTGSCHRPTSWEEKSLMCKPGLPAILQVRGLKTLRLNIKDHPRNAFLGSNYRDSQEYWDDSFTLFNAIRVLGQPYDVKRIRTRAAVGISKTIGPRQDFRMAVGMTWWEWRARGIWAKDVKAAYASGGRYPTRLWWYRDHNRIDEQRYW